MIRKSHIILLISVLVSVFVFMGDNQTPPVMLLWPAGPDSVSYDQGKLVIVSAVKAESPDLIVATQWSRTLFMDVAPVAAKRDFPKDFYKLFDQKSSIEKIVYAFRFFSSITRADSMTFAYSDTMTIRKLWTLPALAQFAQNVQNPDVIGVVLTIKGWNDSLYTPVYDDPSGEGRALYKLHLQLTPGLNRIYVGRSTHRNEMIEYATTFAPGYQAVEDRPVHFHNSALEQTCTTCHEGLPSADGGKTMKADCSVCHKTFAGSIFLHSPVEMKECASCHEWSATKKVFVQTKPVPDLCFDCHAEIKNRIDSSAVPHPVVGECLTCHSAHGTNVKHQLKADVYTVCSSCHDKYTMNHPVGRHPARFRKTGTMNEEISCASCHNPHGSPNPSLLKVGGGRMMICLQCHD